MRDDNADVRRFLLIGVSALALIVGPLMMVDAWNAQDITGRITPDEMVIGLAILILGVLGLIRVVLART